jgi:hypothetical protein
MRQTQLNPQSIGCKKKEGEFVDIKTNGDPKLEQGVAWVLSSKQEATTGLSFGHVIESA